ncbi:hypothetical protein BOX15_Mlig002429g1 [Macrostomum lignano]|uniref:Sugar phosphate transporter domain-containing protein n=1 Tax=Macrostomum lignano TaxID=282301 RepID=A0A267DMK8_9PLAT|nr:hypothetical protein BOX15_Mlig002429g2 [Macrostomum lignano]PAA72525.1 hypothetical protein BOX15_Mlig002429g1 [Macrostomum lignano]
MTTAGDTDVFRSSAAAVANQDCNLESGSASSLTKMPSNDAPRSPSTASLSTCSDSEDSDTASGDVGGGWRSDLNVLLVLAAHWILSSTITFSNSFLVDHRLPNLAILLSAVQTMSASILLAPLIWTWQRDQLLQLKVRDLLTRNRAFLPLCLSFIGMLTFNRMSLRQVGVACLQISRSLTVVFTLAFTYWLLSSPVRRSSLACCGVVIAGFSLGVNQSLDSVTFKGFIFGTVSSLFASMETTLTKKVLPSFAYSPMLLTCALNATCAVLFLPLLMCTDQLWLLRQHWTELITPGFLATLVLSNIGTAAFGVLTYRVIHVTSPLTLVISNSAHTTAQTLVAVFYFRQSTSPLWWLSVFLILLGTLGYAASRANDMRQLHQLHLQQLQQQKLKSAAAAAASSSTGGKIQSV